jgi:hypothetical protein
MITTSTLVLSPGRTGSVLLAQNLSKLFYTLGEIEYYTDTTDLTRLKSSRMIAHSHLLFEPQQLQDITVFFSVRRDLNATLISHYIASVLNLYHLTPGETRPEFAPIEVNLVWMEQIIEQHQNWYQHYQPQLNDRSRVIVYEMMVDHLLPTSVGYQALYPDKVDLIRSYEEVIDWLNRRVPKSMTRAHSEFIDYEIRPSQGMYRWAAGLL